MTGRGAAAGGDDEGAASVLVLAVGLLLVMVAAGFALVGSARVARQQARVAADLGALAGAVRVIEGEAVACWRAAEFVAANGGVVETCRVDGLEIVVAVAVRSARLPGVARAAARAGPLSAPGSKAGNKAEAESKAEGGSGIAAE